METPRRKENTPGSRFWWPLLLVLVGVVALAVDATARRRTDEGERLARMELLTKEMAGSLEGRLERLNEELVLFTALAGEDGAGDSVLPEMRGHLADLGDGVTGALLLGPSGAVLASDPSGLAGELGGIDLQRAIRGAEGMPGSFLDAGVLLADGSPGASYTRKITRSDDGAEGFLSLILSLDDLSLALPLADGTRGSPSFLLMDSLGHLLSYDDPEWVGWLLLAEEDSLYDPQLHARLPEILGSEGGGWALVSEALSEGSWASGVVTLLASSPVRLPDGGRWHLGLFVTPYSRLLPGLPSSVQLGVPVLAGVLLLLALAALLPRGRKVEEALRDSRRAAGWYRGLLEDAADPTVVLDEKGHVSEANRSLLDLLGWRREDLVGVPFQRFIQFSDPQSDGVDSEAPIQEGRVEARLLGDKGAAAEVELNTTRLSWDGKGFFLVQARDVSWRRRIERETLRVGERERLLLGKELHDGLGQHLTGVAFMAKTLARKLVDLGGREAEEAQRIGDLLKDAVGQIRILSRGLELAEYEGRELPGALEEMSGVVRRLMGVALELDMGVDLVDGEVELDRVQATQLYRLCHDVVSDAVRNRLARRIQIRIGRDGDRLVLEIRHDGSRPSVEETDSGSSVPFRLRYRARLLDAVVEVSETDGGETMTRCSLMVEGSGE